VWGIWTCGEGVSEQISSRWYDILTKLLCTITCSCHVVMTPELFATWKLVVATMRHFLSLSHILAGSLTFCYCCNILACSLIHEMPCPITKTFDNNVSSTTNNLLFRCLSSPWSLGYLRVFWPCLPRQGYCV
jgi:hypothetical protein